MATYTFQDQKDWGVSGLTGTLAAAVVSADGTVLIARSTAFIPKETPAGSGIYEVTIPNFDTTWGANVVIDDGQSGPGHTTTDYVAPLGGAAGISIDNQTITG